MQIYLVESRLKVLSLVPLRIHDLQVLEVTICTTGTVVTLPIEYDNLNQRGITFEFLPSSTAGYFMNFGINLPSILY